MKITEHDVQKQKIVSIYGKIHSLMENVFCCNRGLEDEGRSTDGASPKKGPRIELGEGVFSVTNIGRDKQQTASQ